MLGKQRTAGIAIDLTTQPLGPLRYLPYFEDTCGMRLGSMQGRLGSLNLSVLRRQILQAFSQKVRGPCPRSRGKPEKR